MAVVVEEAGPEQQEVLAVVAAVALQTPVLAQFLLKFLFLSIMQSDTEIQQAHQQEILATHKSIQVPQVVAALELPAALGQFL
jgi:hypothetical protein